MYQNSLYGTSRDNKPILTDVKKITIYTKRFDIMYNIDEIMIIFCRILHL